MDRVEERHAPASDAPGQDAGRAGTALQERPGRERPAEEGSKQAAHDAGGGDAPRKSFLRRRPLFCLAAAVIFIVAAITGYTWWLR
jgi:hypothetical protein